MSDLNITITPTEIRDAWNELQTGGNPVPNQANLPIGRWKGDRVCEFTGCSGTQMNDRLRYGYTPENAPEINAQMGAEFNLPHTQLDEEGMLLIPELLAGEDLYRVEWQDITCKRGLTIQANMAFNAGTSAQKIITQYLDWILAVMDAAVAQSVPANLDLVIKTNKSYRGINKLTIAIPVVKAGDMLDVASWRAFLSPGSFRSLGFLAMGLTGEKIGKSLVPGLGYATGTGWDVIFKSQDGILDIDVPACPYGEFPADDMTQKVQAAFDNC